MNLLPGVTDAEFYLNNFMTPVQVTKLSVDLHLNNFYLMPHNDFYFHITESNKTYFKHTKTMKVNLLLQIFKNILPLVQYLYDLLILKLLVLNNKSESFQTTLYIYNSVFITFIYL